MCAHVPALQQPVSRESHEVVLHLCRTFYEGIVPFKPTAYGLHNILKRNDLLIARAKVSGCLQESASIAKKHKHACASCMIVTPRVTMVS